MRFKATINALVIVAITTLHGLAALWCYHHAFDHILIFLLAIGVIWTFVQQALYCGVIITGWLNVMIDPKAYED